MSFNLIHILCLKENDDRARRNAPHKRCVRNVDRPKNTVLLNKIHYGETKDFGTVTRSVAAQRLTLLLP